MLCSSRHQLNNSKLAKWLFLPIENLELHNFNLSAHKNRLGRTNGHRANLQNRGSWTNQHDLQRRPRSPTFPPISPPPAPTFVFGAAPRICSKPKNGFLRSLTPDFLPGWHLDFLTTPHMGTILWDWQGLGLTLHQFNQDLPFITRGPSKNSTLRFSKNGIQFPQFWNEFWFVLAIFGNFLAGERWQANHGLPQTRLINSINTFEAGFNPIALQSVEQYFL